MTVPLAIIGGLLLWREKPAAPYFIATAVFFLVSGLFFPVVLKPIEKIWMKIAELIAAVMTRVILTLTYILVITPIGLILKIIGKDIIQKKIESESSTYWVAVEPDGPCSRPDKPY